VTRTQASAGGVTITEPEGSWPVSRLPEEVAGTLTAAQREALHRAFAAPLAGRPPINLRLSLPLVGRRVYLAVIAGVERRDAARLAAERIRHPLRTLGNILFALGVAMLFLLAALLAIALHSAILEF